MSLSSLNLDAFYTVAAQGSFSAASRALHITQSALSQRVLNLEQEIGSALFIREPRGILLTETGHKLLRYCQQKQGLEQEFWGDISSDHGMAGIIKIAAYSTICRSLVMPVLSNIIKENPSVQLDLKSKEIRQLASSLMTGESEFILMPEPLEKQGLENHLLGHERNVLICSTSKKSIHDVYLDHDEHDSTTNDFLSHQSDEVPYFKRSYLDDIDNIIEGVRLGLGMAVVPEHLIRGLKGIEVVQKMKPLKSPIYLIHYHQSYYTKLQSRVMSELLKGF